MLNGKTAIVTGGGRDIGRACAVKLAQMGASVAINYYSSSAGAEETVALIKAEGRNAIAVQGDLSEPDSAAMLVTKTIEEFGSIDVLVNNAGGLVARGKVAEMTLEHWNTVIDLNLTSTFLMIRACLPHMETGTIINLASQAGRDGGGAGAVPYATSKGAIMTMTRGLAKELGPDIRVNAICPGMIDTDFHNIHTKDDVRRTVEAASPVKRQGTPDDIGQLVGFLASNASSFITGANIDINGGMLFS